MKCVNIIDAKEQFTDLVELLASHKQDKIILTLGGNSIVEMKAGDGQKVETKKNSEKRVLGIGKDELKLPPDFDEVFDTLDEEIGKMFFREAANLEFQGLRA